MFEAAIEMVLSCPIDLPVRAVAKLLGCSTQYVKEHLDLFPHAYRLSGGDIRIPMRDVNACPPRGPNFFKNGGGRMKRYSSRTRFRSVEDQFSHMVYGWMACCNLEADCAGVPWAAQFFQKRQREIERDMRRLMT